MKKLINLMVMLAVGITAHAKCDFSDVTFKTVQQRGNEFYFRTNIHSDACRSYFFTAYDYQLDRVDTLDNWSGTTGVGFYTKGKYQVRLNVIDICNKCDTVLNIDIDITIFNRLGFDYKVSPKDCRSYQFKLAERDTCTQYYFNIYKADKWINSLTDEQWINLTDSALYFGYSWAEDLMLYASTKSENEIDFEFKDSGRYFIIPMLYNTCTGIDTWAMKKLDVCLDYKLNNKQPVVKPVDIKIIGYYDLMGRQVDATEPNKIYIIHYSNGHRRKVMQVQN
jgi:hypothetical protein